MTLQPGDILLNKYRIERLLGQGAFAQVYLATHLQLRAPRALKVLRRDAPGLGSTEFHDYRQRFELEAQLGAALDHPHLIRVYDFEQEGEALILVMEYAAGGSLAERIAAARQEGHPLPLDECVRVAREVAEGLAALHGRDIVHRDLKPSNVLFDGEGRAKVADLGLAQVPGGPSLRSLISQGVPHPGTPAYMSPEQATTYGHLSPASDVYALGAVLFEMLTGRLYRNVRPGTRARELRPEVPEWLDALVARMVAEEPGARPWDGAEVAQALVEGERQRIEAEKQPNELVLELAPGVKMAFVRVPAGEFLMGSDKGKDPEASDDEQPQHRIYLDEYWIGKYPVTNVQYKVFVDATGYAPPEHWKEDKIPSGKEHHPVVFVSWRDTMFFCEWASQVTGQRIRLPTEAEWEKAARGTDGRLYPWGNQPPTEELCNFNSNVKDTTPVGRYSPAGDSPYGCADMAGNVWEWCAGWYDEKYYAGSPLCNPTGPGSGQYRVVRGGSWCLNQGLIRAAYRFWITPVFRSDRIGFRCALSP